MKVKTNLYLDAETPKKIEDLAKATFRGKNDVVDMLVAEAWAKICVPTTVSAETVLPTPTAEGQA